MNRDTRCKYICSTCGLAAFCLHDSNTVMSCLTVCPNCSNVSVPIPTDDLSSTGVRYVTLRRVHKSCIDAVMTGGETIDTWYSCPACGFKKGRCASGAAVKRLESKQFLRKMSD